MNDRELEPGACNAMNQNLFGFKFEGYYLWEMYVYSMKRVGVCEQVVQA